MEQKAFKYDINFLEFALWVIGRRKKLNRLVIEKEFGKYEIAGAWGLPNHFDIIVLYHLLYTIYSNGKWQNRELKTTRYAIVKSLFKNIKTANTGDFARIMQSLKKLGGVHMIFHGVFFENSIHTTREFGIIDNVILNHKTKELYVQFNQQFIAQLDTTKFYKYIDFNEFKKLKTDTSARLYEILCKSFHDSNDLVINLNSLAEKMTLEKRAGASSYYPSDVIPKLRVAAKDISEKTSLKVGFAFRDHDAMCVFKGKKNTLASQ